MTFHSQVVGANGQRQAMFIERVPGLAEVILTNFSFGPERRDGRLLGQRPDRRAGRDGAGRPGTRIARHRRHLRRPVACRPNRTPASAAGCSTRPTSSSTCARRTPTRCARSTVWTPRSALGLPSRRRDRELDQGSHRRAARGARGDATGHHPGIGRRRRAIAGSFDEAYREHARRIAGCHQPGRWMVAGGARAGGELDRMRPATPRHRGRPGQRHDARCRVDRYGGDRMNKGSVRARVVIGLAAIAVIAAACSSSGASGAAEWRAASRRRRASTRSASRTPAASATASARSRSARPRPRRSRRATVVERHRPAARDRRGRPARGHSRPDREERQRDPLSTRSARTR